MERTEVIEKLRSGGIGVLPTDTIYGIVACALNAKAVERVYEVRKRRPDKPCIILIAGVSDLSHFGITVDRLTDSLINRLWPGPVSIVFSLSHSNILKNVGMLSYLHRGTNTLAFRLPAHESLRELLRHTGPLIAPSANLEGQKPAATIGQAKVYFDDQVDFYLPAGARGAKEGEDAPLLSEPSTVVEIRDGKVVVLRQGSGRIPPELL